MTRDEANLIELYFLLKHMGHEKRVIERKLKKIQHKLDLKQITVPTAVRICEKGERMTREEAINVLENVRINAGYYFHADAKDNYECALRMAIAALEQSQWIPCSERLPEEKGDYLVTYHPCYWDDVESEIKVGIDSFRGKTAWAKRKYQRVIAWMPIPEPWKGENNDGESINE